MGSGQVIPMEVILSLLLACVFIPVLSPAYSSWGNFSVKNRFSLYGPEVGSHVL